MTQGMALRAVFHQLHVTVFLGLHAAAEQTGGEAGLADGTDGRRERTVVHFKQNRGCVLRRQCPAYPCAEASP